MRRVPLCPAPLPRARGVVGRPVLGGGQQPVAQAVQRLGIAQLSPIRTLEVEGVGDLILDGGGLGDEDFQLVLAQASCDVVEEPDPVVGNHVHEGIEVAFGGGRRHFLPRDAAFNSPDAVSSVEGDRTDSRDLTAEWQDMYQNGVYVYDQAGFDAIDPASTERVFGLFNESHMQYEADRANDVAGEPSVADMTTKAIDILDNNEKGFFLMVESQELGRTEV